MLYPILNNIAKEIKNGKGSHSYVFVSSLETQKDIIDIFAKALYCKDNGCDECVDCSNISKRTYPDIIYIEAEKKEIRKHQIKMIQSFYGVSSYSSLPRLFVIINAELMNEEASNSFLKILEEPSPNTIFTLFTSRLQMLLPTILSRCSIFRFPDKGIKDNFEEDCIKIGNGIIELLKNVDINDFSQVFNYIDAIKIDRKTINDWLEYVEKHYRDEKMFSYVSVVENTKNSINKNVNVRLAFEVMCVKIAKLNKIKQK